MNRKKRKKIYISIKNSWKNLLSFSKMIEITTTAHDGLPHNPKHPFNMIVMDFKNRDKIVKYGVKKVGLYKST